MGNDLSELQNAMQHTPIHSDNSDTESLLGTKIKGDDSPAVKVPQTIEPKPKEGDATKSSENGLNKKSPTIKNRHRIRLPSDSDSDQELSIPSYESSPFKVPQMLSPILSAKRKKSLKTPEKVPGLGKVNRLKSLLSDSDSDQELPTEKRSAENDSPPFKVPRLQHNLKLKEDNIKSPEHALCLSKDSLTVKSSRRYNPINSDSDSDQESSVLAKKTDDSPLKIHSILNTNLKVKEKEGIKTPENLTDNLKLFKPRLSDSDSEQEAPEKTIETIISPRKAKEHRVRDSPRSLVVLGGSESLFSDSLKTNENPLPEIDAFSPPPGRPKDYTAQKKNILSESEDNEEHFHSHVVKSLFSDSEEEAQKESSEVCVESCTETISSNQPVDHKLLNDSLKSVEVNRKINKKSQHVKSEDRQEKVFNGSICHSVSSTEEKKTGSASSLNKLKVRSNEFETPSLSQLNYDSGNYTDISSPEKRLTTENKKADIPKSGTANTDLAESCALVASDLFVSESESESEMTTSVKRGRPSKNKVAKKGKTLRSKLLKTMRKTNGMASTLALAVKKIEVQTNTTTKSKENSVSKKITSKQPSSPLKQQSPQLKKLSQLALMSPPPKQSSPPLKMLSPLSNQFSSPSKQPSLPFKRPCLPFRMLSPLSKQLPPSKESSLPSQMLSPPLKRSYIRRGKSSAKSQSSLPEICSPPKASDNLEKGLMDLPAGKKLLPERIESCDEIDEHFMSLLREEFYVQPLISPLSDYHSSDEVVEFENSKTSVNPLIHETKSTEDFSLPAETSFSQPINSPFKSLPSLVATNDEDTPKSTDPSLLASLSDDAINSNTNASEKNINSDLQSSLVQDILDDFGTSECSELESDCNVGSKEILITHDGTSMNSETDSLSSVELFNDPKDSNGLFCDSMPSDESNYSFITVDNGKTGRSIDMPLSKDKNQADDCISTYELYDWMFSFDTLMKEERDCGKFLGKMRLSVKTPKEKVTEEKKETVEEAPKRKVLPSRRKSQGDPSTLMTSFRVLRSRKRYSSDSDSDAAIKMCLRNGKGVVKTYNKTTPMKVSRRANRPSQKENSTDGPEHGSLNISTESACIETSTVVNSDSSMESSPQKKSSTETDLPGMSCVEETADLSETSQKEHTLCDIKFKESDNTESAKPSQCDTKTVCSYEPVKSSLTEPQFIQPTSNTQDLRLESSPIFGQSDSQDVNILNVCDKIPQEAMKDDSTTNEVNESTEIACQSRIPLGLQSLSSIIRRPTSVAPKNCQIIPTKRKFDEVDEDTDSDSSDQLVINDQQPESYEVKSPILSPEPRMHDSELAQDVVPVLKFYSNDCEDESLPFEKEEVEDVQLDEDNLASSSSPVLAKKNPAAVQEPYLIVPQYRKPETSSEFMASNALLHCLNYWKDQVKTGNVSPPKNRTKKKLDVSLHKEQLRHYLDITNDSSIFVKAKILKASFFNLTFEQFVDILVDALEKDTGEPVYQEPSPPFTQIQMRLFILTTCLYNMDLKFILPILKLMEMHLNDISDKENSGENLKKVATFYAALCRACGLHSRLRVLIYDVIYSRRVHSIEIVVGVLNVWPFVLVPVRLNKDCLLTETIIFLLTMYKPHTGKRKGISKEARFELVNLVQKIGYRPSNLPNKEDLTKKIMSRFEEDGALEAIVLLCRRDDWKWSYSFIEKNIYPLLESWHKGNLSDKLAIKACLLLGYIGKVFPQMAPCINDLLTNLDILLKHSKSIQMSEAIVESISSLRKHSIERCAHIIASWSPPPEFLTPRIMKSVKVILSPKPYLYWVKFLSPSSSLSPSEP